MPYLQLVDTRGIQLSKDYSVNRIGDIINEYIQIQLAKKKIENFVHCIWYCISSNKFQDDEQDLVNNVIKAANTTKIPVIIVLTQAVNEPVVKEMKTYIKEKGFKDVVDIIAQGIPHKSIIIPPYGIDGLVELTIKKCREGLDGFMKNVMMENLTIYIKNKLFSNNSNIKSRIIRIMMLDTYDNDLANQDFDGYINDIYYYNVAYFLRKSRLENKSSALIKNSEFNLHKRNFISFCQQYEDKIISKEIQKFAYLFLDLQASKEIEKGTPVSMTNKRNYNIFINTTRKFLTDNFDYYAKKYYINFVIKNICNQLSSSFEQELNIIVENLLKNNEIQDIIENCFNKKFSEFAQNAKRYPPFSIGLNNHNMPFNDSDNGDWMNDITRLTYDKGKTSEANCSAAPQEEINFI